MIRVNSQSGKGGIAYLLESEYGVELPRRLHIDLARHVQRHADATGREITAPELWEVFERTYLPPADPAGGIGLAGYEVSEGDGAVRTRVSLRAEGRLHVSEHDDVGPVEALTRALSALGVPLEILDLHQSSAGEGAGSRALSLVEYRGPGGTDWAAGLAPSVLGASMEAVIAAARAAHDVTPVHAPTVRRR